MTDSDQQGSERVDVDGQTEQGPANRRGVRRTAGVVPRRIRL
jgi:hypothetical protein